MSKSTTGAAERLTAVEWLSVRSHVAGIVKGANPRMESSTSVRIAERLLAEGVVDVASVAEALRPEKSSGVAESSHPFEQSDEADSTEGGEGA